MYLVPQISPNSHTSHPRPQMRMRLMHNWVSGTSRDTGLHVDTTSLVTCKLLSIDSINIHAPIQVSSGKVVPVECAGHLILDKLKLHVKENWGHQCLRGDFSLLSSTFIFLHISTMIMHVKNRYISTKFLCSYKHKNIKIERFRSQSQTAVNGHLATWLDLTIY